MGFSEDALGDQARESENKLGANYADPRTTKLYDRRRQKATRGEVERIRYERKMQAPPDEALG